MGRQVFVFVDDINLVLVVMALTPSCILSISLQLQASHCQPPVSFRIMFVIMRLKLDEIEKDRICTTLSSPL